MKARGWSFIPTLERCYKCITNLEVELTIAILMQDIATKIMSFSQQGPRAVCILSANGAVSTVTLRQPATSGGTVTYEVHVMQFFLCAKTSCYLTVILFCNNYVFSNYVAFVLLVLSS